MAYTDREDLNYLGQLFMIGAEETPLWTMLGATGRAKITNSFKFPIAQPIALSSASQNTQSEATAAVAGTPTTYTRAQDTNVCQIMKYDYSVSFAKQSTFAEISGVALANGTQPVTNERDFQKMMALKQMALDIEYSFLQGTYTDPTTSATNGGTRGLSSAITTNTVAASSAVLSESHYDELFLTLANSKNWKKASNRILMMNSFQKQRTSKIFQYQPASYTIGGVNIDKIITNFGELGVVYNQEMPTDEIFLLGMDHMSAMFCPYEGQLIVDVETPITAAQKGGFLYTQIGLDYGPEEYHAKISGLATS